MKTKVASLLYTDNSSRPYLLGLWLNWYCTVTAFSSAGVWVKQSRACKNRSPRSEWQALFDHSEAFIWPNYLIFFLIDTLLPLLSLSHSRPFRFFIFFTNFESKETSPSFGFLPSPFLFLELCKREIFDRSPSID